MVELVVVLVLVGILAAFAAPRLNNPALKVVPVAEEIAAEIRYAQGLAMTRSQSHTFSVGGGEFSISNASGAVALSSGRSLGSYSNVTATPATITFSPRFGQPGSRANITVSGGGSSATVVVEPGTGYVRIDE
jgi:MSHA pilin protein MshC